jgi:predicted dehydrogenase
MKELNVAIIGYKFMGRAHSNAWQNITNFFDVPFKPVLKVACGRKEEDVQEFADRWGWEEVETDWKRLSNVTISI